MFLRTFLPWQAWRFAVINLKMLDIIRRSHNGDHTPRPMRRAPTSAPPGPSISWSQYPLTGERLTRSSRRKGVRHRT